MLSPTGHRAKDLGTSCEHNTPVSCPCCCRSPASSAASACGGDRSRSLPVTSAPGNLWAAELCPDPAPRRGCSLSLFLSPCAGSWRCVQDISVLLSLPQPHGALLLARRGCFLPRLAWWRWGLLASLLCHGRLLKGEPSRPLHKSPSPLSLGTRLLVVSGCCLAPARPGCREVPSLILLSFGALIAGQRWSWVRGLTPISRAGSHHTLLSNSSRSSVFKTSSKNHQEGERQARSFPLPTNSNGAGIMDSHQHAHRQPPARERGSAFTQGRGKDRPPRGLTLLPALPGAVLPEHMAQGSLPDLYQQRWCDSSCLICFVLPVHLTRNAPAASEICAAPQKNLKKPRAVPEADVSPDPTCAAPPGCSGACPRPPEKPALRTTGAAESSVHFPALSDPACGSAAVIPQLPALLPEPSCSQASGELWSCSAVLPCCKERKGMFSPAKRPLGVEEKLLSFVSSSRAVLRAAGPLFRAKPESTRHKGGRGTEVWQFVMPAPGLWALDHCQGLGPGNSRASGCPQLQHWERLSKGGQSPRNLTVILLSGTGSPAGGRHLPHLMSIPGTGPQDWCPARCSIPAERPQALQSGLSLASALPGSVLVQEGLG